MHLVQMLMVETRWAIGEGGPALTRGANPYRSSAFGANPAEFGNLVGTLVTSVPSGQAELDS